MGNKASRWFLERCARYVWRRPASSPQQPCACPEDPYTVASPTELWFHSGSGGGLALHQVVAAISPFTRPEST